MTMMKKALAIFAVTAGAGVVTIAAALPAQAGDSARINGCAAHWRNTAAWNECINSPGTNVRLYVDCNNEWDHTGNWHWIQGSSDPVDRHECTFKAQGAWNQYS